MSFRFLFAFSFSFLLTKPPAAVLCQEPLFSQNFVVSYSYPNYCPAPSEALDTCPADLGSTCAFECMSRHWCIYYSYYTTIGQCYFYSVVPQKMFYDADCTFLMDEGGLSGCPEKAHAQGLCNVANDDFYGCLAMTTVTMDNENLRVCLDPPPPGHLDEIFIAELPVGNGSTYLIQSIKGWIPVMERFDGSLDFNQNWTAYRNGFGDAEEGEFWLGNEKLHLLTNRTGQVYRLRVEVQLNATGRWLYADYATFSLDSEDDKYAIHVSGYTGNAGDSLTSDSVQSSLGQNGMNFTTRDSDNDRYPSNCADYYQGGWWFNRCYGCCLTCQRDQGYFAWAYQTLRAARMMVKEV